MRTSFSRMQYILIFTNVNARNVFKVLEQLKLDLANFQLQMIKPHLRLRAAEHEREKFQEFLEISQGQCHTDVATAIMYLCMMLLLQETCVLQRNGLK